jgi:predicted methyltransferase
MMRTLGVLVLAACASTSTASDPALAKRVVAAPDRTEKDRGMDAFRKPVELLGFAGVAPGMRVADLGAGGGYSTELLARAVGPGGAVFAQDTPNWDGPGLQKAWEARLGKPALGNTKHFLRQWDDPLPPEATNLDLVTFVGAYHDVIVEKSDEDKLNRAVFAALKPGGVYIVIDNSARAGTGKQDCEPLHRIDEALVRDEVQRAGFKLAADSPFMRNPADTRDWNANPGQDPRSHTQDLFALKFVKP